MTTWADRAPTVGDRAAMTRTVEAADIIRFTELSGDRNPVHYDAEVAARTRFGEVVVQGPSVVNSGAITADSDSGRAGYVEVTSQNHTYLTDGSIVSASAESSVMTPVTRSPLLSRTLRGEGCVDGRVAG